MSDLYNIVYTGKIDDHHSRKEVMENLKVKMGVTDSYIKKLFSGDKVLIKKEIPLSKANSIMAKLESLGALASLEAVFNHENIILDEPRTELALQELIDSPVSKSPVVVERHIQPHPTPHIVVVERGISENHSTPKASILLPTLKWLFGASCLVFGLLLIVEFEPLSYGVIKRGLIAGVILCILGGSLISNRHGAYR